MSGIRAAFPVDYHPFLQGLCSFCVSELEEVVATVDEIEEVCSHRHRPRYRSLSHT